jgi:hypothetical protein
METSGKEFNSWIKASVGTKTSRRVEKTSVLPDWQYTQSKVQVFWNEEIGSIPRERPNLQEETGP